MKLCYISLLFTEIFLLACFVLAVSSFQASVADERIEIPGTRVSLVPPEGFEPSGDLQMLQSDVAMGAIVVVETWPHTYAEASELFQVKDQEGGLVVTGRREVTQDGYPGFIAWDTTPRNGSFRDHWILVLDGGGFSLGVTVMTAKRGSLSHEAVLAAFETVQIRSIEDFDLREQLGYRFHEAGTFEVYSIEQGKFVTLKSKGEVNAQFKIEVVPRSRCGPVEVPGIALLKSNFQSIFFVSVSEIDAPAEIVIDGLPGVEYLANGVHIRTEEELAVYHATLSERCQYYRFIGYAPRRERDKYIAEFRRMTESFARK